ncbi:MAG: hypothetical protein ABIP36_03530 [Acidimicrobiales bacterium]
MARRTPPRTWLLVGLACGILAVVLVRSAVFLVVGSFKVLAVVAGVGLIWLFVRGPRDGRR